MNSTGMKTILETLAAYHSLEFSEALSQLGYARKQDRSGQVQLRQMVRQALDGLSEHVSYETNVRVETPGAENPDRLVDFLVNDDTGQKMALICRYQDVAGSADVKWAELRNSMAHMLVTPAVVYAGSQLTYETMVKNVHGFQRCGVDWVSNLVIVNFALDLRFGL